MLSSFFLSSFAIVPETVPAHAFRQASCFAATALKSASFTMLYLSKTERVFWPEIIIATLRDPGPNHVSYCRSPEVVKQPVAYAGIRANRSPRLREPLNLPFEERPPTPKY